MMEIIDILNNNARYTNEEIAAMTGKSQEAVESEIKNLEKMGVICGYKAIVDWEKFDKDVITALVELNITPEPDTGYDEVAKRLMSYPLVESVYLMSGGFDLTVKITGQSFQEVAQFIAQQLSATHGVQKGSTHFILKRYKEMGVEMEKRFDDRGNVSL